MDVSLFSTSFISSNATISSPRSDSVGVCCHSAASINRCPSALTQGTTQQPVASRAPAAMQGVNVGTSPIPFPTPGPQPPGGRSVPSRFSCQFTGRVVSPGTAFVVVAPGAVVGMEVQQRVPSFTHTPLFFPSLDQSLGDPTSQAILPVASNCSAVPFTALFCRICASLPIITNVADPTYILADHHPPGQ